MINKKKALISVLVVITIILIIKIMAATGWNNTALSPVTRFLKEIVLPVQKGITFVTEEINGIMGYFSDNEALRQTNKELTSKTAELEEKIYHLKEQELENQRLRDLLDYKQEKEGNYDLAMAKIVGRNPGNWYKTIIIDKGTKQGIKPNMPVVNYQGLIGTVARVTENSAEVLLILDSGGAVGGRIFENRVTPGIVIGDGTTEILRMIHIPHDIQVEAGQTVVTSGLGELYPKGIRIGTILEVKPEANGLMQTATIRPFVDFSKLEEVFVILHVKSPESDTKADIMSQEGGSVEEP